LLCHSFLEDFRKKGKQRYWPVVREQFRVRARFFKIGLTIAALKAEGTMPEVIEEFMAWVIEGQTQSMIV
jgi:hypothetical protein